MGRYLELAYRREASDDRERANRFETEGCR